MKKILFLALVLVITTACNQTKESYLGGLKSLVKSVQKNAQDYAKADWGKADEQFMELKDSYNKLNGQMALNGEDEIVRLEPTYTALKLRKIDSDLKEGAKDIFEKAKNTTKDVAEDTKRGTQRTVRKGEGVMERIGNGLKDQPRPTGLHISDR